MNTYLFDFDGTLVDSMPVFISTMLRILDENEIPYGDDIIKILTPLGINGTADYFIQLGVKLSKEEIIEKIKEYMLEEYFYHIPAKNNVIPVLQQLKASGAHLNLLTASPHITLDACLKRLDMFELFDHVWSCDDFATTKADPEIYKMAAARIGKPVTEILFLDDNLNADRTAKEAGMLVCGVFDTSSEEYVEEIKAVADYYIYDFSQLPELFL